MRQLNFAAEPNYNQEFREVQRLFRRDLAVPLQAATRQLLEQVMHDTVANQVQAGWHQRGVAQRSGYREEDAVEIVRQYRREKRERRAAS